MSEAGLKSRMLDLIAAGELGSDGRLPTERALAGFVSSPNSPRFVPCG